MVVLSYTVYMVLRYKHIVVFPFSRVNCIREITVVNSGDLSIYINTFWGGGNSEVFYYKDNGYQCIFTNV